MSKFILGKKIGMTRIFTEGGVPVPVTLVQAGPLIVTQVRTKNRDGYLAVQFGYDDSKKKQTKAMKGHLKKSKAQNPKSEKTPKANIQNTRLRHLREFRPKHIRDAEYKEPKAGDIIDVSIFQEGDAIKVTGISKGKGFQGVVKRHGFKGAPKSHGHKGVLRSPGSIGSIYPQRVIKGKRMAGHMGHERVTISGLRVVTVDAENHTLAISGAVPGRKGTLLEIVGR